jgi:MtrB/PioB family decaheme-associated outer membrane protein
MFESANHRIARLALPLSIAAALACFQAFGAETEQPPPDTSNWDCKACPFVYGRYGYIDFGAIGVDSGDYQYGKYTGLNHSGGYLLLDGEYGYRDEQADYWKVDASRLGLLSRSLSVEGGRQGLFELTGSFQGIPYYRFNDAFTPFRGASGNRLALPSNWVAGASTQQMTALADSLNRIGIRQKREIAALGARFMPRATNWKFDVDYRHDKQTGTGITGANFLTTTSLLAAPLDYATDQVDAGAQYAHDKWQIRLGYYGSFFHDADSALTWNNPFTPYVPGANVGRMTTAPDNDFNQFSVSGAWQILPSTRLMASGAFGAAKQDDGFIASTINPDLAVPQLPRSSLDGRIDTRNYTVRLTSRPAARVAFTADYVEDTRNNKTAQAAYTQAVTDVFVGSTLTNLPYSFYRRTGRVLGDFTITRGVKLEAGMRSERYHATFQDVAHSVTPSGWAELRMTNWSRFGFSLKYDRSHRMVDQYQTAPGIIAVENPLLRRFDQANRIREQVMATAYVVPVQSVSLGLSLERNHDNYENSQVGLTGDSNYSLNLTGDWTPTKDASLGAYLTRQIISANQAGSQAHATPDWFAHTADRVSSGGFHAQWKNVVPKLNIGANLYASYTNEVLRLDTGSPYTVGFPDNTFRDIGLRLFAGYELSKKSSMRFDYWHERYRTHDRALDGVEPATIPNVLSLGISSPNFTINQFAVSYRYEFQ